MLDELFLNSMQSFDFDTEIEKAKSVKTAAAESYVAVPIAAGGSVASAALELTSGEYNRLSATAVAGGSGSAAVTGNVTAVLNGVKANFLFLTNDAPSSKVTVNGSVTLNDTDGVYSAVFVGGINASGAAVNGVNVTLTGTTVTSAFYGNGMSSNAAAATSLKFTGVTAGGYVFAGAGSYNFATVCGDIAFTIASGTYTAQIFGGSRIAGDRNTGLTSQVGTVTLNLNGGTFSNYVFAGGCGVGYGLFDGGTFTSQVTGGTAVNLNGAVINHELYAGGFGAADPSYTTAKGAAVVNYGTAVTAKSGSVVNLYGGGYCSGESSVVYGGANITVSGLGFRQGTTPLTIGTVYGGGNGSGLAAAGSCLVDGGTTITIGGNVLTANVITVKNVYGGGNGAVSAVKGGSRIIFAGNFTGKNADKLSVTGVVSGSGRNGGTVEGTSNLEFNDFQGNVDARIMNFDAVTADGYTEAAFTRAADLSGVGRVNFNFSQNEPIDGTAPVLEFASGVAFSDTTEFTLEFQARAAKSGDYTLILSADTLDLTGNSYTLTDSLYGDSFSATLGDGSSWSYYGFDISMQQSGNNLLLTCTAQA
ncbi:MAG: hypothetical protein PHI85_06100 [Victivallaceae bacterium]|nr:hypothetical protein [Victivallaceae bacterium]